MSDVDEDVDSRSNEDADNGTNETETNDTEPNDDNGTNDVDPNSNDKENSGHMNTLSQQTFGSLPHWIRSDRSSSAQVSLRTRSVVVDNKQTSKK